MNHLQMLGLSHATAPLSVREKLAFNAEQRGLALQSVRARFPDAEAVLLSTCNRVELYAARPVHGHPRADELLEFLAAARGVDNALIRPHFYQKENRGVVEHLFTVASSLDSMVLGETQILGQVREAYEAAAGIQAAGALLNPLFQRAIAVGKQVIARTGISEGRVSVASVAVDYARRIFERFDDKTVLAVGAGKMGALVLQSFAALRPANLFVCNRDREKAEQLAAKFHGHSVPFATLPEHLARADVVISSTSSSQPIIRRDTMESALKLRRYRPIFLIDIALPRDVEEAAGELEHVYLYNIDDLQHVVSATYGQRQEAIEAARAIIAAEVEGFISTQRTRTIGPLIERLYARYHRVAQDELQRTLAKMGAVGDVEKAHLEELMRRLVNKLLHDPIERLKRGEEMHGPAAQYLHALEKLFELDNTP